MFIIAYGLHKLEGGGGVSSETPPFSDISVLERLRQDYVIIALTPDPLFQDVCLDGIYRHR